MRSFSSEYPSQVRRRLGLDKMASYSHYPTYRVVLKVFNLKVGTNALPICGDPAYHYMM
jgi:hypothetical protein